jgi:hypothetical protein
MPLLRNEHTFSSSLPVLSLSSLLPRSSPSSYPNLCRNTVFLDALSLLCIQKTVH